MKPKVDHVFALIFLTLAIVGLIIVAGEAFGSLAVVGAVLLCVLVVMWVLLVGTLEVRR